jgi:L-lactate dehydrogenase
MEPLKESTVLLLVANPVDVLVYFAQRYSGLPPSQVIGSGTFLDSLRLRGLLAEHAQVAASSIDAYVLGEHGDSQFVAWSLVTIGGVPIAQALPDEHINRAEIAKKTKKKAHAIIEAKGATAYGIGSVVGSICGSILFDKHNVRPISHFVEELGCCLSLPVVLGRKGVVRSIQMPLADKEKALLRQSAEELRGVIERCEREERGE